MEDQMVDQMEDQMVDQKENANMFKIKVCHQLIKDFIEKDDKIACEDFDPYILCDIAKIFVDIGLWEESESVFDRLLGQLNSKRGSTIKLCFRWLEKDLSKFMWINYGI